MKNNVFKIIAINVAIAVAVVGVLLLIVSLGLKSYTRHGESTKVPALKGMILAEAVEALEKEGLEYAIMDSSFNTEEAPMSILEQTPKAGTAVKSGRTIYLVVNAAAVPTVEIPNLVGNSSVKYAKLQLQSLGFKVGELIYKPDPHLNAVIGLQIKGRLTKSKMRVPRGTVIDILVGDGLGGESMSLPYIVGLRLDEAEFKLRSYGLHVGAIIAQNGVNDTSAAIVYKQVPEFRMGSKINSGEAIDLFLAKELPDGVDVHPEWYELQEDTTQTAP